MSSRSSSLQHVALFWLAVSALSAGLGCALPSARPAPFRVRPDSPEIGSLLGPFDGRVLDGATATPVVGALVYATWSLQRGSGMPTPAGFIEYVGSTDANGGYRVPSLTAVPNAKVPSDARVTAFSLLVYKRGFIAYRNDRRFGDLGPRLDFAQRANQVLLERWRDDLSHSRHLRYVGGGAAVSTLTQWELADAVAELDGARAGGDLRPGRTDGPYLVAAQLLGEADIKARTKYDGSFETGPLADEPDTATYSSQHYKAMGRAESWDVALRMWRLGAEGAQERYEELLTQLPNINELDTIATRSFSSSEREIRGVAFLDAPRGLVVLLTCGSNQCSSDEDTAALAETIHQRIEQLFPLQPTGTPRARQPEPSPSPSPAPATPAPAAPAPTTEPAAAPATPTPTSAPADAKASAPAGPAPATPKAPSPTPAPKAPATPAAKSAPKGGATP
ncbi:MAG: hypothetical protein R3B48_06210 [Kofleriaceae bacterium]